MREITLGTTGIRVPQNAFGALPVQRVSKEAAVALLRRAYNGGIRFFDTARAYSDSEEKLGAAFEGIRDSLYIATKTQAKTPEMFWEHLNTSLELLKTDHVDIYQFHFVSTCYRPGDGTGLYECMQEAKAKGKIRHIGITTHRVGVAEEIVSSGLYETLQYPFSYLSSEREMRLARTCIASNMGFIAMKALAGGLINNSRAAMAFMLNFGDVLPIWGIQREKELDEWLSFMKEEPEYTDEIKEIIEKDRAQLEGGFCRGCGYCMPCSAGIEINSCARMSLMVRRAPSEAWLTPYWQEKMEMIDGCVECGQCMSKCPYGLKIPSLLKENLEDYRNILAGKVSAAEPMRRG